VTEPLDRQGGRSARACVHRAAHCREMVTPQGSSPT
jgi:hypothetical protein